ncbi:MAG: efflux RND transporter periplasmic adaptor subunit [Candidatus Melainabacteria bacterium]|nr:efflux RND transporter periplasmic adaptor subunit [Candidatus Melainabacteria bacterium]
MAVGQHGKWFNHSVLLGSAIVFPVLVWLVWYGFLDEHNRPIVVTGTIQAKEILVASKVGGRIARVLVQEGQMVDSGQELVEFDLPELESKKEQLTASIEQGKAHLLELKHGPRPAEIDKARAAAQQALANWQMLQSGYRQEDILKARSARREAERSLALLEQGYRTEEVEQARALMNQAQTELDWAEKDWQRYQKLAADGAVSQRDAEQLKSKHEAAQEAFKAQQKTYQKMVAGPRTDEIQVARERLNHAKHHEVLMVRGPRAEEVEIARQQYLQAKAALTLLEQGTRYEEIIKAQAKVAEAKAALKEVEAQLKEKHILAPADSEVSVMDLHAGEVISPNKSFATLTRLDSIWTRVYLPERELSRVRIGQVVSVKVDAFPGRKFRGTIVQIPSVAEFTPRNVQTPEERSAQVFGLKVTIENKDRLLRGGMNAEVTLPPVMSPWGALARSVP